MTGFLFFSKYGKKDTCVKTQRKVKNTQAQDLGVLTCGLFLLLVSLLEFVVVAHGQLSFQLLDSFYNYRHHN